MKMVNEFTKEVFDTDGVPVIIEGTSYYKCFKDGFTSEIMVPVSNMKRFLISESDTDGRSQLNG